MSSHVSRRASQTLCHALRSLDSRIIISHRLPSSSSLPRWQSARRIRSIATATQSSTTSPVKEPPPSTKRAEANKTPPGTASLTDGLADQLPESSGGDSETIEWSRSYHGLGGASFSEEAQKHLLAPLDVDDIEIKPDGMIYLPEIKYRRILNRAFGPGAWGLVPRGESIVTNSLVTREYALIIHGRLVSIARGEQKFFEADNIPTATEGCKSNALVRCCKDIGIASELWDPRYIRRFVADRAREVWVEHQGTKKRRKIWIRKDDQVRYPFKEVSGFSGAASAQR